MTFIFCLFESHIYYVQLQNVKIAQNIYYKGVEDFAFVSQNDLPCLKDFCRTHEK